MRAPLVKSCCCCIVVFNSTPIQPQASTKDAARQPHMPALLQAQPKHVASLSQSFCTADIDDHYPAPTSHPACTTCPSSHQRPVSCMRMTPHCGPHQRATNGGFPDHGLSHTLHRLVAVAFPFGTHMHIIHRARPGCRLHCLCMLFPVAFLQASVPLWMLLSQR